MSLKIDKIKLLCTCKIIDGNFKYIENVKRLNLLFPIFSLLQYYIFVTCPNSVCKRDHFEYVKCNKYVL